VVKAPRSYPVPLGAQSALLGAAATLDQLDYAATCGNTWAYGVVAKENSRLLASICGDDMRLPLGVLEPVDDDMVVSGLIRDGVRWTSAVGWHKQVSTEDIESALLDAEEVAFVARALSEGYQYAVLRSYTPVAILAAAAEDSASAPAVSQTPGSGVPANARVIAIVDPLDREAVLDVVAVLPGPRVFRRHDGRWLEDPSWVNTLRSVKPPPVVVLDEAQIASVLPQVDEATKGQPFTKESSKRPLAASAALVVDRADQMAIEFAILAAGGAGGMPHQLRTYWTAGPGAAKIRWGSPGAMTRCHRYLMKYLGSSKRAYQTCNNISKALGGKGVAWDVG
jgi:hypothetical protein